MNFRTMVKSLRLSWIGRFLDGVNANWKAIPNYFFNKYGGLTFLLKLTTMSIYSKRICLVLPRTTRVFSRIKQCIRRRSKREIYTMEQQGHNN